MNNHTWKDFYTGELIDLRLVHAMALANAMTKSFDYSNDPLKQAIIARKIADHFLHGITPTTQRMEAPL